VTSFADPTLNIYLSRRGQMSTPPSAAGVATVR
jgi:hypothetical protein